VVGLLRALADRRSWCAEAHHSPPDVGRSTLFRSKQLPSGVNGQRRSAIYARLGAAFFMVVLELQDSRLRANSRSRIGARPSLPVGRAMMLTPPPSRAGPARGGARANGSARACPMTLGTAHGSCSGCSCHPQSSPGSHYPDTRSCRHPRVFGLASPPRSARRLTATVFAAVGPDGASVSAFRREQRGGPPWAGLLRAFCGAARGRHLDTPRLAPAVLDRFASPSAMRILCRFVASSVH